MKKQYLILCFVLLGIACSNNDHIAEKPDNLLNEEKYVDLLFEMQMLKVLQYYFPPQDTVDSLKRAIFDQYEVEEDSFIESHRYYQSHLDEQLERVDKVIERLKDEIQYFNEVDSLQKIK